MPTSISAIQVLNSSIYDLRQCSQNNACYNKSETNYNTKLTMQQAFTSYFESQNAARIALRK